MKKERQELIATLEEKLDRDVYILFTASGMKHYLIDNDLMTIHTEAIYSRRKERRKNALFVIETNGGVGTAIMAAVWQLKQKYEHVAGCVVTRGYSAGTMGMFATHEMWMCSLGFLGPIDSQFCINRSDADLVKPVTAYFNAFIERKPDARESEFAQMFPDEYLMAINDLRYSYQTIFPAFVKHCKKKYIESTWEYFNGGAGRHATNINRTKARKLGLIVKDVPEEIEEILMDIIFDYTAETNMMVDSISELNEKDAYFETKGLTYAHYYVYEGMAKENEKNVEQGEKTEEDKIKNASRKVVLIDKYCIEEGWKKE